MPPHPSPHSKPRTSPRDRLPNPATVASISVTSPLSRARAAGAAALVAAGVAAARAGRWPIALLLFAAAAAWLATATRSQALAIEEEEGTAARTTTIRIKATAWGGWRVREVALDAASEVADVFLHEVKSWRWRVGRSAPSRSRTRAHTPPGEQVEKNTHRPAPLPSLLTHIHTDRRRLVHSRLPRPGRPGPPGPHPGPRSMRAEGMAAGRGWGGGGGGESEQASAARGGRGAGGRAVGGQQGGHEMRD